MSSGQNKNTKTITNANNISNDVSIEIKQIFDKNELDDLKRFMRKRQCLNNTNMSLIYLYHFTQSAGIFTTTIAAGYDQKFLIWVGIALNILASLINVYEKTNNNMLKKIMVDIKEIKEGNYIGEGPLVDIADEQSKKISADTDKIETKQAIQLISK